jgi:hypothetical protein
MLKILRRELGLPAFQMSLKGAAFVFWGKPFCAGRDVENA